MRLLLLQDFTSCIFQLGGLGLRSWSVCLWKPQCALEMLFFFFQLCQFRAIIQTKQLELEYLPEPVKEKICKPVSRHLKKIHWKMSKQTQKEKRNSQWNYHCKCIWWCFSSHVVLRVFKTIHEILKEEKQIKWIGTSASELRCHSAPPVASWTPSKYYE